MKFHRKADAVAALIFFGSSVISLQLGLNRSSELWLVITTLSFEAFLLFASWTILPRIKPFWSMILCSPPLTNHLLTLIFFSFSGALFAIPTGIVGVRIIAYGSTAGFSSFVQLGYWFSILGILGAVLLFVRLSSKRLQRVWYRDTVAELMKVGELDWCIRALKQALAISNDHPEFMTGNLNSLGAMYFRKGQYELAIEHYTKAIELHPSGRTVFGTPGYKQALAYTNRAEAYIAINEFDKAADDCKRALEIDSTDNYAQSLLDEAAKKSRG